MTSWPGINTGQVGGFKRSLPLCDPPRLELQSSARGSYIDVSTILPGSQMSRMMETAGYRDLLIGVSHLFLVGLPSHCQRGSQSYMYLEGLPSQVNFIGLRNHFK